MEQGAERGERWRGEGREGGKGEREGREESMQLQCRVYIDVSLQQCGS